jgi:hypothetical protein
VTGKDFTDSHAPVMTEVDFRLALLINVIKQLCTGQFYIETKFLYSELDEEIYVRLPDGYGKYMLDVQNFVIDPSAQVILLKMNLEISSSQNKIVYKVSANESRAIH